MENPAWYTPYTPYQPEIAQGKLSLFAFTHVLNYSSGRLESLVNYQTMIMSLTSMDIANASLLDEATAAAEGMVMALFASPKKRTFAVDEHVTPQTIAVLRTRAKGFGINVLVGDVDALVGDKAVLADTCGVLVQYPDVNGSIRDFGVLAETVHASGGLVVCASDLLALTKIKPPGEWGADVVVGNSGRFGVPAGYGGPHAAFFAVTDKLKRKMPGRLIGRSRDTQGKPAYRLSLQSMLNLYLASIRHIADIASQLANNISDAKRPLATSVPVKRFSPTWPQCMLFTTARMDSSASLPRSTNLRKFSRTQSKPWDTRPSAPTFSTPLRWMFLLLPLQRIFMLVLNKRQSTCVPSTRDTSVSLLMNLFPQMTLSSS